MNNSLERLLEGIAMALRRDVIPGLTMNTPPARRWLLLT